MKRKRYLSIKEFSAYIGRPVSTIYYWAWKGVIPVVKLGYGRGRPYVDMERFERIMERSRPKSKKSLERMGNERLSKRKKGDLL